MTRFLVGCSPRHILHAHQATEALYLKTLASLEVKNCSCKIKASGFTVDLLRYKPEPMNDFMSIRVYLIGGWEV